ncbi:MAG: hypothetical protein E6294_16080, partial [Klebsiella sp.]|nr:hypothetical protein [Klebsiella sp.]
LIKKISDFSSCGNMNYLFILISLFFCERLSENSLLMKSKAGKVKCLININHIRAQSVRYLWSLVDG